MMYHQEKDPFRDCSRVSNEHHLKSPKKFVKVLKVFHNGVTLKSETCAYQW